MNFFYSLAFLLLCVLISPTTIYAQDNTKNQPFADLAKKVREEYGSLDYVSIYNKIPFIEVNIPNEKTLDNTKPNSDEK
jgi:hypothetical protein